MTLEDSDRLTRFLLPHAGVRGVRVHLDQTWQHIRQRGDYSPAVAELLGETCAAAALFTGHTKVQGRLSIQLRAERGLRTLFAECTAAGTLRGIARVAEGDPPPTRDLRDLGESAILAITIENPATAGREPLRYQGLVPLESDAMAGAFEAYFRQSEQLATRLMLAVEGDQAAGLMLQKLPGDEGDADGWNRASALFDTLKPAELLGLPTEEVVRRLYHEESPQLLGGHALSFACSCSRERVAAMLESLGDEEAHAALQDGQATVHCEFCGEEYRFDTAQIDALFTVSKSIQAPPPEGIQ